MFAAPHGAICARLLPFVMEANVRALRERAVDSPILARYDRIAQLLTSDSNARAQDGINWIRTLCADLQIAPLSKLGLTHAGFAAVIAQAQKASSMKGNPLALTDGELQKILEQAL
jgi:alcohol dehydrogenase class IV